MSFVDPKDQAEALAKVQASQPADDNGAPQPAELPFNIKEVYSFKYRVDSVRRSITRIAIREARLAELKQEVCVVCVWLCVVVCVLCVCDAGTMVTLFLFLRPDGQLGAA